MGQRTGRRGLRVALGAGIAAAAVLVLFGALGVNGSRGATVQLTVRDAVSASWVWDLTATLQGRVLRRFYQSDQGPVTMQFTRLRRGAATLELEAPSYLPVRVPLTIRGRLTRVEEPIEMVGYEIPDLADFLVFESPADDGYVAELRPIRSDGSAAVNHPCMDLWVGCMVSVQTKGGAPVTAPTESGAERGKVLVRERLKWEWDGSPDAVFRYHAPIPAAAIRSSQAPFLVFDYLIVVPDPRRITSIELDAIMAKIWGSSDIGEALAARTRDNAGLRYFIDTSWNVERPR